MNTRIMFEVVQGMRLHRTLNNRSKIIGMYVKPIFVILFGKQFKRRDVRTASKRRQVLRRCFCPDTSLHVVGQDLPERGHEVGQLVVEVSTPPQRIDPGSVGFWLEAMIP